MRGGLSKWITREDWEPLWEGDQGPRTHHVFGQVSRAPNSLLSSEKCQGTASH